MESIRSIYKGYGKVNPHNLEDQTPHHQKTTTKPLLNTTTVTISVLMLTLIIGLMLAALIHESITEPPDESPPPTSIYSESIKTVCNVTRFPTSCFNTISSLNISTKPDPETIFKLSLQVSLQGIKNVSSQLKTFNDMGSHAAVNDCLSQFDDALSRVNDSLNEMEVGTGEKALTLEKINDIQTWVSAAMTDQDTCVEGLQETGSMVPDEIKARMESCKEMLSNSLAIVANMESLLEKFGLKMH